MLRRGRAYGGGALVADARYVPAVRLTILDLLLFSSRTTNLALGKRDCKVQNRCRTRAGAHAHLQVPQFICPVGSYCPDGVTPTACPAGTTSIAAATHPTDCFSQAGPSDATSASACSPCVAAFG